MARAIMVSDHVYAELLSLKGVGESFTRVIDRFIHGNERKKNVMDFAGAWSYMSDKEFKEIEKGVKNARKNWRPAPKW